MVTQVLLVNLMILILSKQVIMHTHTLLHGSKKIAPGNSKCIKTDILEFVGILESCLWAEQLDLSINMKAQKSVLSVLLNPSLAPKYSSGIINKTVCSKMMLSNHASHVDVKPNNQ